MAEPQRRGDEAEDAPPTPDPGPRSGASLLLVDGEAHSRARLQRVLAARGFAVTSRWEMPAALAAAAAEMPPFACAVVELRLVRGGRGGLDLVERLRGRHAATRIVAISAFDSFALVVLALRAGAVDYLPKPVDEAALMDALLGRAPPLPPLPEEPLGVARVRWEHVLRIFEQCGRNVTETARRLGMHRRSLQRMLGKRAPRPRRLLHG